MSRQSFWSEEAKKFLESCGRQDLVDKGDALAERVTALITSSMNRLRQYCHEDDLYNGKGGTDVLDHPDALVKLDDFVNIRLRQEIDILEKLLETFDDLRDRKKKELEETIIVLPTLETYDLPDWY